MTSSAGAMASLLGLTLHKGVAGVLLFVAAERVSFSTSTAILLGELMKLLLSIFMLARGGDFVSGAIQVQDKEKQELLQNVDVESEPPSPTFATKELHSSRSSTSYYCHHAALLAREIVSQSVYSKGAAFLILASTLYVIQNNSFLIASKLLDPTLLSAIWQLRIIATAIASVLILGRRFSGKQIFSMFLLIASVLFINEGLSEGSNEHKVVGSAKAAEQHSLTTGLIAIFVATIISGVAGVIVELVLKNSSTNMWMANCQMSIYSLAPAIFLMTLELLQRKGNEGPSKIPTGFDGFSQYWPWVTVFFHGGAGLLVAFVTKYASTIAKSFSGAFSIIITLTLSVFFGVAGRQLPEGKKLFVVILGMAILILSTYLYSQGSDKPCRSSSDRDEEEETTQK